MHRIYVSRSRRNLGSPEAARLIKKAARAVLDSENITCPCVINVTLTDDDGIKEINSLFRGIDSATDVLSFPQNEFSPGKFDADTAVYDYDLDAVVLGDMVMSLERAEAQGREYGHGSEREIAYLAVHSVLHLLGYDHVDEGPDKKLMRGREDAIMSKLGILR